MFPGETGNAGTSLSPCPTYRPEQMDYKRRVHAGFEPTDDRTEAFRRLLADDHFTTGLLYRAPGTTGTPQASALRKPENLVESFRVRRA